MLRTSGGLSPAGTCRQKFNRHHQHAKENTKFKLFDPKRLRQRKSKKLKNLGKRLQG